MEFSVNHPILFIIVGAIIALVLAQSIYFLVFDYIIILQDGLSVLPLN